MKRISTLFAMGCLVFAGMAEAHPGNGDGPRCDPHLKQRSAAEVLESHRAALAAGDWEAVRCNYAEDAVVITDGGVVQGVDAVVAALQQLGGLFGGSLPTVDEEVVVSILDNRTEMARVIFHIETPCVDIPDGADTYVIRRGKIHAQTAHGLPVFKCGFPPF